MRVEERVEPACERLLPWPASPRRPGKKDESDAGPRLGRSADARPPSLVVLHRSLHQDRVRLEVDVAQSARVPAISLSFGESFLPTIEIVNVPRCSIAFAGMFFCTFRDIGQPLKE